VKDFRGGWERWKTTSAFHRHAIVDNQDVADKMNYLCLENR
jgi:hypothetical protein